MGSLFLLPIFLQNLLGFTAMQSGVALMPRAIATGIVMPLSGRIYNRIGARTLVGIGLAVSALSFWQLAHLSPDVGAWDLFMPQVWQGVGFGLIFVALSTAALSTIERPKMTAATGLYNVVRQVFGSVGIALAATELTRGTARFHDLLAEHVTAFDPVSATFMARVQAAMTAAGSSAGMAYERALRLLDLSVTRQAAVLAYNHVFALVSVLFVLALPLVFLLSRPVMGGAPMEAVVE